MTDEELLALATDVADQTLWFSKAVDWDGLGDLKSQLQRAAISVPSNITEGIGRDGFRKDGLSKMKVRFYLIAYGSLRECLLQLELLKRQRPDRCTDIAIVVEAWLKVRGELVSIVDSTGPLKAEANKRLAIWKPSWHPGDPRKREWLQAVSVAVQDAIKDFLAHAKGACDGDILKLFAGKNGNEVYFSLEAFRKFMESRGRRLGSKDLSLTLRMLGWRSRVCRFGKKTPHVWVRTLEETGAVDPTVAQSN